MPKFLIDYTDPESGEPKQHECEFEDWTGRASIGGKSFGPEQTITARQWAEDLAYSLADKGPFTVTEIISKDQQEEKRNARA